MIEAALCVLAYLLGSIPTGVLLSRARGVDIRGVGSGNIGATNVARALGPGLGVLTLLADCAKGAIPVVLARQFLADPLFLAAVGASAILGHVFSLFLRLRGGKGVATAFGVFLALAPAPAAVAAGLWALVYAAFRISSVASLLASLALPALAAAFGSDRTVLALAGIVAVLLVFTHRSNLRRLFAGREGKV